MDETKRVIVEQDDDVKVIVKPSAASKKLTVDDEHEIGLSWDEQGVHFRVDETDDLPVAKAVDTDMVDGKHASDLQNYNNLTNKPDLKKVATTGSYNDLEDKPEFLKVQVQADWNETNKRSKAYIKNKPTSFSSDGGNADTVDGKHASDLQDYNNLTNKPDIPVVVGNAKNAIRLKDGKSDYQMGEAAVCLSPTAQARGNFSFAEGNNTYTFLENAHAEGFGTIATGNSHAEGYLTIANGISTIMTVEEYSENVVTLGNRYERFREELIDEFFENAVIGSQLAFTNNLPEGSGNLFIAAITAIDKENRQITLDKALDAESKYSYACPVTANESMEYCTAHAEGNATIATGIASHVEGEDSTASGYASHSEGYGTKAIGDSSHAEGQLAEAIGEASHAEGEFSEAIGKNSHAEGAVSESRGEAAHAEGSITRAYGESSHAEGHETTTEGKATHAEGYNTIATTLYTAMEIKSMTVGDAGTVIAVKTENTAFDKEKIDAFFEQAEAEDKLCVVQIYSNATFNREVTILSIDKDAYIITVKETFGSDLRAHYIYPVGKTNNVIKSAHAEGSHSIATGYASHAEGYQTIASGENAHAEGEQTEAVGKASHAEGSNLTASGDYSHAEGLNTVSSGKSSHAEGQGAYSYGEISHAEGDSSTAVSSNSHAEGEYTVAAGGAGMRVSTVDIPAKTITLSNEEDDMFSQAAVIQFFNSVKPKDELILCAFLTKKLTVVSIDKDNHSIVVNESLDNWMLPNENGAPYIYKIDTGTASHAEGSYTTTANIAAHAEGQSTKAIGKASHAEGKETKAIGESSHAEGEKTTAKGKNAHAQGKETIASGENAHAEGISTISSGRNSHAEGDSSAAICSGSHAEGIYTIASSNGGMYITSIDKTTKTMTLSNENDAVFNQNTVISFFDTAQQGEKLIVRNIFVGDLTIEAIDKENHTITVNEDLQDWMLNGYIYTQEKEGVYSSAEGSHAEGKYTISTGRSSHAEGNNTKAVANDSHAEGVGTLAKGANSHAEGITTKAIGESAHAEGDNTTAAGKASHAEGMNAIAQGYCSHAEGDNTKAEGKASHAEGDNTKAEGKASHAEGFRTTAKEESSHAEGYSTIALSGCSHVEGGGSVTTGAYSHAEGYYTLVAGNEGMLISAIEEDTKTITLTSTDNSAQSQAILTTFFEKVKQGDIIIVRNTNGNNIISSLTIASVNKENYTIIVDEYLQNWFLNACIYAKLVPDTGRYSHAEGMYSLVTGYISHAEGYRTQAKGAKSHAEGEETIASNYQHAGGKFNVETAGGKYETTEGSAFVIGNGISKEAHSNCFRVQFDGKVFSQGEYATTGADYAELFEWEDKNEKAQDRRGLFVALKGTKIHIADSTDKNIIGIISSKPAMVGNNYSETWKDMYFTDLWGDVITEHKTIPAKYETVKNVVFEKDENGEEKQVVKEEQILVSEAYEADVPVLNPDYNKEAVYIPRHERKEWGIVGMLGQLIVQDDGSCEADGYCKCADGGIATKAESGYYIMERIDASHIRVLFK